MEFQEGSVLNYVHFRIFHYPLGFSVGQADHITELVNEWFPTRKFKKIDTTFRKDSTYNKGLMDALNLTEYALHNAEI